MDLTRRAGRYARTVRHIPPRQLVHLALRSRERGGVPAPQTWPHPAWDGPYLDGHVPPKASAAVAERALRRTFAYLGRTVTVDGPIAWDDPSLPLLWRFHLNAQEELADLALAHRRTGDPRWAQAAAGLAEAWWDANPTGRESGWHPYPLSLRIVSWARALAGVREALDADRVTRLVSRLGAQVQRLAGSLEFDVRGNHLIENARALVFGGSLLGDDRRRDRGLALLETELRAQTLDDGGHEERSPSYHLRVLRDTLDVLPLAPGARRERLTALAHRMSTYLDTLLHPDGTLPLFNDGVAVTDPSPRRVLERARDLTGWAPVARGAVTALDASGYYVLADGADRLIVDAGQVCPGHLPAHAHCDLLSFELAAGGRTIIANRGTFTYEAGPRRDAYRGTAAHNTVQVGAGEQSEIWGAFRVGRRARVEHARPAPNPPSLHAAFRGFAGNRYRHARAIVRLPGVGWLVLDALDGPRLFVATARLHLTPAVRARVDDGLVELEWDGGHARVSCLGATPSVVESDWSPEMGVRLPSSRIELRAAPSAGPRLATLIVTSPVDATLERLGDDACAVTASGVRFVVRPGPPVEVATA